MEPQKQKIRGLLKRIADWLLKNWIIQPIILFIAMIYLPVIVKYLGEPLKLLDQKEQLTGIGWTLTIALYTGVLIVNLLSCFKANRDKRNQESLREELKEREVESQNWESRYKFYSRLVRAMGNVCVTKLEAVYNYIVNAVEKKEFHKPFNETVMPEHQLKSIAKEIKMFLSDVTGIPINHISVSMAYDFPRISNTMRWLDLNEVAQCMSLHRLRKNHKTTFYKIYQGKHNFLFYNDKIEAEQNNNYVFDNQDKRYDYVGSIICDNISIEDEDGKIARVILTISTYGHRFVNSDDVGFLQTVSDMIKEVLVQEFEKRIKIELALLFIKKQYNKNK